jgi:hypothetical protein
VQNGSGPRIQWLKAVRAWSWSITSKNVWSFPSSPLPACPCRSMILILVQGIQIGYTELNSVFTWFNAAMQRRSRVVLQCHHRASGVKELTRDGVMYEALHWRVL